MLFRSLPRVHLARLLAGLKHQGEDPSAIAVGGFVAVSLVAISGLTGQVPQVVRQIYLSRGVPRGRFAQQIAHTCFEGLPCCKRGRPFGPASGAVFSTSLRPRTSFLPAICVTRGCRLDPSRGGI